MTILLTAENPIYNMFSMANNSVANHSSSGASLRTPESSGERFKTVVKSAGETVMSSLHSVRRIGEVAMNAFREAPLEFDVRPPRKHRIDQI